MRNYEEKTNKNYIWLTLEGSIFFFGIAFFSENTIIPMFVDTFTGSLQLLGLTLTLITVAKLLPKFVFGPYIAKTRNMSWLLKFTMILHRVLPFIMIPVLLLVKNHTLIFWIFLLMLVTFWGINGVSGVAWSDVFARTIPPNKRGQLQGNQLFIGGIASLLAGYVIKLILDNASLSDNIKYLVIFTIGGIVILISALVLIPVKDVPREVNNQKVSVIKYFKTLPKFLNRNKKFRSMMIAQSISRFGDLIIPFIVVLCKDKLDFSASELSTLIIFQVAGGMLGGITWGSISRKFGNRNVIVSAEITGLMISATTLFCVISNAHVITFPIMCFVVALSGAKTGGWVGYSNYMLDIIGEENRIDYITLNTLILFPLSFANYFAGLANEKLGFLPLIIFCAVIGIVCTYIATQLKDVRHEL